MTDYYVSSINPSASDSNAGTDPLLPWATLDKVEAFTFGSGDRVLLERGSTFSPSAGNFTPPFAWNSANPTALLAAITVYGEGACPIIDAEALETDVFRVTSVSDITFEMLDITGGEAGIRTFTESGGIAITACLLHDNGNEGIRFGETSQTSRHNVTACLIYDNGINNTVSGDGISGHNEGSFNASFCTIYGHTLSGQDGVTTHETASCTVSQCTVYGNEDGFHFTNTSGTNIVERCFITDNDASGVRADSSTTIVRNNVIANSTTPQAGGVHACVNATGTATMEIFNNSIYIASDTNPYFGVRGGDTSLITVKNNVFDMVDDNTFHYYIAIMASGVSGNIVECDTNCFQDRTDPLLWISVADDAGGSTFAEWQALTDTSSNPLDPNSVEGTVGFLGDPSLSPAGGKIPAGSDAEDLGEDLTAEFTNDYSGRTRPNGAAWDAGAFEISAMTSAVHIASARVIYDDDEED